MLVMFRLKNYMSFREEAVLDLRAVSYKEMKGHVIQVGKNSVVKTLAIFGKNAGGKSNLISALYYFESFILNQFFADGKEAKDRAGRMPDLQRSPFRLRTTVDDTSEFEIIFVHGGNTYQYGFSVASDEEGKDSIEEEWLLFNDATVFERKKLDVTAEKRYRKEIEKLKTVRQDRLFLGILDYFSNGEVKTVVDGLKDYLKNGFNVHMEYYIESSVKGVLTNVSFSERLLKDESYRKVVESFVKNVDVDITRLVVEEVLPTREGEGRRYSIKTGHRVFDEEGKEAGEVLFDLSMESAGTLRYFSFIQYILSMLEQGGVFIIDEISSRLHPILTKFIVDLFQSEKNDKAQLVFTTHDISFMDRKRLRRDEIAFVDKNEKGESSIYTLADIKIRSDASYAKDYLNGKYGAIPVVELGENKENEAFGG